MKKMIQKLLQLLSMNPDKVDLSRKTKAELDLFLMEQLAYSRVLAAANIM